MKYSWFSFAFLYFCFPSGQAADWPMWRKDPARTASTTQEYHPNFKLKWVRELPPLKPAYRDNRLQFDAGYEPIAFGNRIFISSSFDNSVTAFDAETGEELWKFETNGPVRFAPAGGKGRVIFGSDDGYLYCVRASKGDLVWKHQAVPLDRKLIGNDRLISVWPVRGGPVLKDEKVYFAAGVWPLEGVFVYCLDARNGDVIWLNDRCSYIYGQHPHNTEAFGGLAPQGYLLIDGNELVVPSSNAYPARFDLATGELKDFKLPAPGRLPGGWFAASRLSREARRGEIVFDSSVNQKRHEDKMRTEGDTDIRNKITLAGRDITFDDYPGVNGTVSSIIAADGNTIISTEEGKIHCFGESLDKKPVHHNLRSSKPASPPSSTITEKFRNKKGYALILDANHLAKELADHTSLRIISVSDARPDTHHGSAKWTRWISDSATFEIPPYFADLIYLGSDQNITPERINSLYESLRPFGGMLVLPDTLNSQVTTADLESATIDKNTDGQLLIHRAGSLKGTTNYLGDLEKSPDALVKAPLGILWFGDQTSHFKRAPQPKFVNGVMISIDKDWLDASTRTGKVDYRLLPPKFTDVYTGRALDTDEVPELRQSFSEVDRMTVQPSQYRPPKQTNHWKPDSPKAGTRINPLTGESEPRTFPKLYGCDGGIDYGNLYTMRSGTAAFYDLISDSGTINISGPRSGCTNSIIPANGVLNVPYFYEGCTCSYPLPMGLSLISMPETFEQWMSWGTVPFEELAGKIQQIGINLGAPGDRKTNDGTLWLDYPDKGGPSPQLQISTDPPTPKFHYRHSLWMTLDEESWPWVAASGATNLRSISIDGFKPGNYTVKLTFSNLADKKTAITGKIRIQKEEKELFQIAPFHSETVSFSNIQIEEKLTIQFPEETTVCGIEVLPE